MQTLKQVVFGILNLLIRVSIAFLVVVYVYRMALATYHFGYMVFTDGAKEVTPGRDITVSIEMDDSVMDIGKTLEKRGVIDDARLFFVQEYLSEYHKMIKPGNYTLNTSMRPSEILKEISTDPEEELSDEDERNVTYVPNDTEGDAAWDKQSEDDTENGTGEETKEEVTAAEGDGVNAEAEQ